MRRIDCHMHFWTLAMEPYYALWMSPDLKVLYGNYGPRDAQPLMAANEVVCRQFLDPKMKEAVRRLVG